MEEGKGRGRLGKGILSVCPGRQVGMWDDEGEMRLGKDGRGSSWEEGMESGHPGSTLQLLMNLRVVTLTFILQEKHIHKENDSLFFFLSKLEDRKIVRLTYSTFQVGRICWLSSRSAQIMSI